MSEAQVLTWNAAESATGAASCFLHPVAPETPCAPTALAAAC